MDFAFWPLLVLVALSGALIGRWWALFIPFIVWPIFFLGVRQEWWGNGLGDGWQFGFLLVLSISLVAGIVGLALRVRVMPRSQPPAPSQTQR
jgi:hypothetical protein